MRVLQYLLDRSKQLNQTPHAPLDLAYHAPNKKYKIIHQALIIPNLPAPLHYLNFSSMNGQLNVPMLSNPSAITTTALDTATVICSISPHMHGHFNHYSIQKDCKFENEHFEFSNREKLSGSFPDFQLIRNDLELNFDLNIKTSHLISHFTHMRFSLAEHWSLVCRCQGQIQYQDRTYVIDSLASFEYARSFNFPHLSLAFFTYQVINLSRNRQILLMQIRDTYNRIVQSRIYLRDLDKSTSQMFDNFVYFNIHRVYPKVTTPNGKNMYLPREFSWSYQGDDGVEINLQAKSRGDFKFGLAAGFVGSFSYQININNEIEKGKGGYCEYVDCRSLHFQEVDKTENLINNFTNFVPILTKR